MKTLVGIPCLYGYEHTYKAIESVVNHDCTVLLIDNGAEPSVSELLTFYNDNYKNVILIKNKDNVYVNPAWNQIMKLFLSDKSFERLCIMNSDVIMHYQWLDVLSFVEKFIAIVPCPQNTSLDGLKDDICEFNNNFIEAESVAGIFIALNRKQVELVYPIPNELKVWFGDNWIYDSLRKNGYSTVIVDSLKCFHYGSQNVQRVKGISEIIEQDKLNWSKLNIC